MWHSIGEKNVLTSTRAEHRATLRAVDIPHPASARLRMGTYLVVVRDFSAQSLG
jgi:hypothetical protein